MRHKFWLPSQMYSKRKEPLCAGGKAYGRSFLFACGVRRMRKQDGRFRHPDGFRGLPDCSPLPALRSYQALPRLGGPAPTLLS